MKKTKKKSNLLKYIVTILVVILISLVSFVGVYCQKNGTYINKVKDYALGMELKGTRTIALKPDDSTNSVTKDQDGKVVENPTEEQTEANGYTKEDVPANAADVLNEDNYKESKKIIEKRLNELNFEEYTIRQDLDTGKIILELAENDDVDKIFSSLVAQGKFEIKDSETDEVLIDNSKLKDAKVMYNTTVSGTAVYLDIELNKEGAEKLEDISSNQYATKKDEDTNTTNTEKAEDETSENNTAESTENETQESSEDEKQKEIIMEIDGQAIVTTSFDEPIKNGRIQLTVGQASNDNEKIQEYVKQARNTSVLLSTGNMPVKYTSDTNQYIKANISGKYIKYVAILVITMISLISICLILKYRAKGFIGAILAIGYMAIILLILRYTNVEISIAGILALAVISILNYVFGILIISNSNKNDETRLKLTKIFGKYILAIMPIFIISIVFSFATNALINSFGMIMFWGITISLLYNLICANTIFKK